MLNEIDLSRADLNLLVLFEAVMRDRNVGRAAARLNLSPSAVSHGLGRLRALLGDPLFLRTPRGMVPTDRAAALAPEVDAILAAVRGVIAAAAPFDPATSDRRFAIGAADALYGVIGPLLVADLAEAAPRLCVSFLSALPEARHGPNGRAWDRVLQMLESRALDLALLPAQGLPARFAVRPLWQHRLVAAVRAGHPFALEPTLDLYCAARHMLVSDRGDPSGATDGVLESMGRTREIVLTVPSFTAAMILAAESDMIVSVPEGLLRQHGARFGLVARPLPVDLPASTISLVATAAALQDAGVAWLAGRLAAAVEIAALR
jgi:DNA-binding transcriptional LysR family regulator